MLRLDRLLVTLGVDTRSGAGKRIRKGAVTVDGVTVTDPAAHVDEENSAFTLDGMPLDTRLNRHVMLHKPAGLLTAARDKKQPTVMDLLPPVYAAIGCMPVGRLDKDTTGLLIFTTDGEMNHRLLSPGRHVDKEYLAAVDGPLTEDAVRRFAAGLDLGDFTADPAELTILSSDRNSARAKVIIHEGKFHQVKRMFEAVGRTVTALHRPVFGPITLPEDLPEGQWRELTDEELSALRKAAGMEE